MSLEMGGATPFVSSDAFPQSSGIVRFGSFEADLSTRELRKGGLKIRLQGQPFEVLALLLQRPGELITREDLQAKLWASDTFVDFEHGLNKAINRVREALGDDADNPRFVETLPRRGYRFVAPVVAVGGGVAETGTAADIASSPAVVPDTAENQGKRSLAWRWRVATLATLLLLLAAATSYLLFRRSSHHNEQLSVVPFTTYPGAELNPSFSPDGNQIAFAWTGGEEPTSDGFDLYVKQVGVERPLRLTTHPALHVWPAWSPDGSFIAFSRRTPDTDGIFITSAIGGSERKLADTHFCECFGGDHLSWSTDGKGLAFADREKSQGEAPYGARAYLLNLATLERQRIPDPSQDCVSTYMPVFSPDGKTLALVCMLSIAFNIIYVQPIAGGPAHEIARADGNFGGLSWTEDGKELIYATEAKLWRVSSKGGPSQPLVYAQDAWGPTTARTKNRMAYVRYSPFEDVWRLDLSSPTKPKGVAQPIAASSYGQWVPHISPDGRRVAFDSDRSGSNEIWVSDSDGSNPIQLTNFKQGNLGVPRWSPDSQRIVFDTNAGGPNVETYTMRVDGGLPQRLSTGTDTASHPAWSKDGRWIYFDQQKHGGGIWKAPSDGGQAVPLTNDSGIFPQESADGTRVFYALSWGQKALWSAAVAGGDAHPVEGMPAVGGWHWVPAPSGIYFIDLNSKPGTLNLFDFVSHRVQRIGNLRGGTDFWGTQISISRDGRTLLYSEADRNEGDIMLVESFQ
jgi:Tol biopolymer transport system component/DNA-binding winged helix-turn-helix (wHTH) protein